MVNGRFQKNKGIPPFSRTNSAHYGDLLLSLSVGPSSQGCPILHFSRINSIEIKGPKTREITTGSWTNKEITRGCAQAVGLIGPKCSHQLPVNIVFLWHILLLHPPIGGLRIVFSSPGLSQWRSHHKSRTSGKYRSIAARNLCRYCLGEIIVGSPLPAPPRNADSLTQLSNFLSHV